MNKYREEILGSVSTERLLGSLTLGNRRGKLCFFFLFFFCLFVFSSFTRQLPHFGPKGEAKRENKLLCGSKRLLGTQKLHA